MRRRGLVTGALALAAVLLAGAGKPKEKDWSATVTISRDGYHVRGNPQAPIRLIEYVSYSCPHCGIFEMEGGEELTERFIKPGSVAYEIRPFFLNEIDKTLSLIAYCGPPAKFFGNTTQLLKFQHHWLRNPTRAQVERWSVPDWHDRARAMTEDLGLYTMMEKRGYNRTELDKCLADEALVASLQKGTEDAFYNQGVKGTPAFKLNGELLPVNTWPALRQVLAGIMKGFV
ncbi:MAG: thioredoxin domain-containing protein [Novosphingobium sp.]|jgi:protein-disulfide isomerase|nr:thioredoxin domain-containing protein [Novosphingobium sp.]